MAAEIRITISSRSDGGSALKETKQDIKDLGETAEKSGKGLSAFREVAVGALRSIGTMGLDAAISGFKSLAAGMISGNAEFERYQTQFGVLLGSADEAKKRLDELAKFGASTPFELPELVRADKVLTSFGIHSQDMLTIVGDVAAGTGVNFEEMALTIGKFSAGATGEALSRFQELGIATKQELAKMGIEFDKAGSMTTPVAEAMPILEQLMKDKFGGMMDAQSKTFEGMLSNLQDWVGSTMRTLGAPIFDVLKEKLGGVLDYLGSPEVKATLDTVASALAEGIGTAMTFLTTTAIPALMGAWQGIATFWTTTLQPAFATIAEWLSVAIPKAIAFVMEHWEEFKGALIAIGAVLAGAAIVGTIVSIGAAIASLMTPIGLIVAAVALLGAAWAGDWLGIRTALTEFWETTGRPIFEQVVAWLSVNIPIAIQAAIDFWNNYLLPALTAVWTFISETLIPILTTLAVGTFNVLNTAVQGVAGFWNNVLKPALSAVWTFLNTYVIPLFTALANVTIAAISLAARLLAGVWTGVVLPALKDIWNFLSTYLNPILTWLYETVINNGLKPALQSIAFFILGTLIPQFLAVKNTIASNLVPAMDTAKGILGKVKDAFGEISGAIQSVISWIQKVADKLNSIKIPDWLQGHSPPPMADWFRYIGEAAKQVGKVDLPTFGAGLAGTTPMVAGVGGGGGSNTRSTAYNQQRSLAYSAVINNYGPPSDGLDYALAASLAGV